MALFQHSHLSHGVVHTPNGNFAITRGRVDAPEEVGESYGWLRLDAEDQPGGPMPTVPLPDSWGVSASRSPMTSNAAIDKQIGRCVSFLLRAMVAGDADVAFLSSGQRPYVIGPGGTRPLWDAALSVSTMRRFLTHLLPEEDRDVLAVTGAAQHQLPPAADLPSDRFTIAAEFSNGAPVIAVRRARVAVRRARVVDEDRAPINPFTPAPLRHADTVHDDTLTVPTAAELWGPSAAAAIARARRPWL